MVQNSKTLPGEKPVSCPSCPWVPFTEAASTENKTHAVEIWNLEPKNKLAILTLQGRMALSEGGSRGTSVLGGTSSLGDTVQLWK